MAPTDTRSADYDEIVSRLKAGTIVPFLGAGASIACGFPSGRALAERLAARVGFPDAQGRDDLPLVASYFDHVKDSLGLRAVVREAFDIPAKPGRLHTLLSDARLEAVRLFVTTNYDDLLERALEWRAPSVVVDHGTPGKVWCRTAGGDWDEVEAKHLGYRITDRKSPIILKMHGSFDRDDRD